MQFVVVGKQNFSWDEQSDDYSTRGQAAMGDGNGDKTAFAIAKIISLLHIHVNFCRFALTLSSR